MRRLRRFVVELDRFARLYIQLGRLSTRRQHRIFESAQDRFELHHRGARRWTLTRLTVQGAWLTPSLAECLEVAMVEEEQYRRWAPVAPLPPLDGAP